MLMKITDHLILEQDDISSIQDMFELQTPLDFVEGEPVKKIRNTIITLKSGAVIVAEGTSTVEILNKLSIYWVENLRVT